jgi:hypothetical protein
MARSGYQANHRGRQTLVWADGPNEAQRKAASIFRAKPIEVVVRVVIKGRPAPESEMRRAA